MKKHSLYESVLRASPYPYLVMDPDLRIVAANDAYLRAVQRREDDLVGLYLFDAFPPDPDDPDATDVTEVRASLMRALTKGQPDTSAFIRYAVPVPTADGPRFEERYWSSVHTPIFDDDGRLALVVQNPVDLTEFYHFDGQAAPKRLQPPAIEGAGAHRFNQGQMHEALTRILNNEREHLRSLFNQAPGFVAVLMGEEHVFEMVNEAYYQLVGHRDLIGKAVLEALPEVAGQGYDELLDRVYRTGEQWAARAMPISLQPLPDGPLEQRYIDLVYQPYKDANGKTIGIFAQGYDVTDAVEAQAAKRESEERLRDGMEAAKMVVWDWIIDTGELAYSENMPSVLGCTPTQMQALQDCVHPEDREQVAAAHRQAIAETGSYQQVVRFIRPDNHQQIWVDSRGKVQFDINGRPTSMRGVTVDVTERYRAELELRVANRKKDEFLAMLAHELRNPLAPIVTAAEMLKLVAPTDARVQRASEVIGRQVKHMTALIDDLLDVSRVTRGLVALERESINIKPVVANAIEQARGLIDLRRHHLIVHIGEEPVFVQGDRTRLVQVLTNLLNNAAKYTPPGGEIVLDVTMAAGQVRICVSDNGIGIEAELVPHIFDLFTQAERSPDRGQGGLGIGLALVKSIVALHGGEVTAQSRGQGTGSRFTVTLPAEVDGADFTHMLGGMQSAELAPIAIMVVDDNVDAAQALAALLEMQGHRVSVHHHPQDAIGAARLDPPEVYILDIGLPEMDGYELARRLREDERSAAALFIALTGYGRTDDRSQSMQAGFQYHFVKPLDIDKLNLVLASRSAS
ncbi:ATP-binding protein [Duganella sp. PWIR1]